MGDKNSMTINIDRDSGRGVRIKAVSISLFLAIALLAAPLSAAEKTGTATATGTVDIRKNIEKEYQKCINAELTEKDLPDMMEFYSQYPDAEKAAVVQTRQCLAMMSKDDGAACDIFKDMEAGAVYYYGVPPPGATSTVIGTLSLPSNVAYPADTEGCLELRKNAVMMQKAVTSPEACGKELLSYCKDDLYKLVNPKDKSFTCDRFAEFTCVLLDLDTTDDCEAAMTAKFGKLPDDVNKAVPFCRNILSGEVKSISPWMLVVWLGGMLKEKNWPILADDFNTNSFSLNPTYNIYAGAVKKYNSCFFPITPALQSSICTGIAKYRAGVPNPDKKKPAGADGSK